MGARGKIPVAACGADVDGGGARSRVRAWAARVGRAGREAVVLCAVGAAACGGVEDEGAFSWGAPLARVELALRVGGVAPAEPGQTRYRVRVLAQGAQAGALEAGPCQAEVRGCFDLGPDDTVTLLNVCAGRWRVSAELFDESLAPCSLDADGPTAAALCGAPSEVLFAGGDAPVSLTCARPPAGVTFDVEIR